MSTTAALKQARTSALAYRTIDLVTAVMPARDEDLFRGTSGGTRVSLDDGAFSISCDERQDE